MKIAIASCAKIQQTNPQPVWWEIQQEQPDILILLGDTIYLDHNNHSDPDTLRNELNDLYRRQFAEPNFAALWADLTVRKKKILAIYDDHDFLGNNRYGGDDDPEMREAARNEFISWFRPIQTGPDVYSYHPDALVDIVVLDERYYRTAPQTSYADRDAILGAEQWNWLEGVFENSTAPYLLIASSTTIHRWGDEAWEQYPGAFHRLQTLFAARKENGRAGALVVSGDIHCNTVYDDTGLIEIVTSGVAREGLLWGAPRKNYAILNFDVQKLNVDLRSLKAGWRFNFDIPLNNWVIP